ncbi:MAG: PEP-CTERM sorting domain-containing protein [Phycisphaerales bacterium]
MVLGLAAVQAQAQLRIVTFNTANATGIEGNVATPRTGMDLVLQAIGDETYNGYARPIDILMLQEQDDVATTTQDFVDILNSIYGAGTYARGTVLNAATTQIHTGMVYNTTSVTLLEELAFGQVSGTKSARQPMRYKFRPVGYSGTADFYVYNSHYKADTQIASQERRQFEAQTIRANSDALGQGQHILYLGDYNIQSSTEDSYQTMLAAGNGQAFDPINTPGTWHNDIAFAPIHTQSPHDGSDGLAQGGMDDRLDFHLATSEFLDNEGLSYIPGSYHAFGNNGTTFNLAVNAPSNTYPLTTAQLNALAHVSDHLPVVADYQLPAKMLVTIDPIPAQVIVGADVSVTANVSNAAPVSVSIGADELDYTINALGFLSGGGSGSVDALTPGDDYELTLNTSTVGPANGQVNASSISQGVANGTFFTGASTQVLAHANASFASGTDLNLLTIDFGTLGVGGTVNEAFDIFNLVQTLNFTAGLDLDSILGSGDTAVLTTNLASFINLAAGASAGFLASFDTSTPGSFSAMYTLNLSDQDLAGATDQLLILQLLGEVVGALNGDLDNDGFVGITDLNIVLGNWNTNVAAGNPLLGDPSGDGFVGIEDLNTVLGNWNAGTPPQADAAIPEPATGLMLLGLAAGLIRATRK